MVLFAFLLVANSFAIGLISANPLSGLDAVENKILTGSVTTIEKNPWQAALLIPSGHIICSGSIIGDKWVLSVASREVSSVRVGSSYHSKNGQIIRIKRSIKHEQFNPKRRDFDFALHELAEPLTFTAAIKPISLPNADYKIEDGTVCQIAGWGETMEPWTNGWSYQLRAIRVAIVNQEECAEQWDYPTPNGVITDRMICAGEDTMYDFCRGDEGGPLVEFRNDTPRLIGIASFESGCFNPFRTSVYSRVTSAREWIKSKTGI